MTVFCLPIGLMVMNTDGIKGTVLSRSAVDFCCLAMQEATTIEMNACCEQNLG
jgi:hypothetical protein